MNAWKPCKTVKNSQS